MSMEASLLLLVESSAIGASAPDLGEKLMHSFFVQLLESGSIPARAIFMGTGVILRP